MCVLLAEDVAEEDASSVVEVVVVVFFAEEVRQAVTAAEAVAVTLCADVGCDTAESGLPPGLLGPETDPGVEVAEKWGVFGPGDLKVEEAGVFASGVFASGVLAIGVFEVGVEVETLVAFFV